MSNLREVNDITVILEDNNETYLFPAAFCIAVPSGEFYDRSYKFGFTRSKRIYFADIVEKYGTTNIIDYLDYLAANTDFYRYPVGGGGSGGDVTIVDNQTDYATETTSAAILSQLQAMTQFNQGFIDYNDTSGAVSLIKDTWTSIPNNGQGAFTNKNYKPEGVTELLDETTGQIDVTELDLGDTIIIRNDFQINPNTNNALLQFRYQLGTGAGSYVLETTLGRLDSGSGQNYRFALKPDLIYMGDTNTRNNPITLQVKLSSDGTLTNAGTVIQVIKR